MSDFEELVAHYTAKGSPKVHAAVFLAADRNGKKTYSKSFGFTSLADDAPSVGPDNVFNIASCTKLLTSIAVMQCVERGILTLDSPVNEWLPEFDSIQLLVGTPEQFELSKPKGAVTLRTLITHSSGIGYDLFQPILVAWRKSRGEESMHTKEKITKGNIIPLLFEPGLGWEYGAGLDIAGLVIMRANKMTLEEYFQKNILKPLGMEETTFRIEDKPELQAKLVHVCARSDTGDLTDIGPYVFPNPPPDDFGGHGLFSTPNDYVKVLADVISESPRLLGRETMESLFKPQFKPESAALKALELSAVGFGQFSVLGTGVKNHGLAGSLVPENLPIGKTAGTMAWAGYAGWVWFANRNVGIAGVFATHVLPPADTAVVDLANAFIAKMFSERAA